jgi:hypothetical protein
MYLLASGEVTTPQLHFCVSLFNSMNSTTDMDCMSSDEVASLLLSIYYGTLLEGEPTSWDYFTITMLVCFLLW